jgi:hypothetical protein
MVSQSDPAAGSEGTPRPAFRSGDSTSRRVLEDVLKRTAALNTVEQQINAQELEALVEVAHRFPGMEFQFDPVVIELVRATLGRQVKPAGQTNEQFAAVAERVARTLFDNPETQERLRSLWIRLSAGE